MRTLPFYQVDVFTDRPFAGNPLAVFPDADGLTAAQMQAIASEMNLSAGIVTTDLAAAQRFTDRVDAAAVMVNASTAFTDGEQFGFGAEIGISTQKLHARGPMGLAELTSTKWIVIGDGHIRPA